MPTLRLFASAREAAGTGRDELPGETVGELLASAADRYGPTFVQVLATCKVWVNGESAADATPISAADEVAVLPPVSGGSGSDGETNEPASPDESALQRLRADPRSNHPYSESCILPGSPCKGPAVEGDTVDPTSLSLDDLRAQRTDLQLADDAVSYVRRIVQGRLDMVIEEKRRRVGGTHLDMIEDLPTVFGRHLTGGPARPPRPTEDSSDHPLAIELDLLCSEMNADRVGELDDDELELVVSGLEAFEHSISHERQELFVRLDALSAELVHRYRDGEASVEGLLAEG